MDVAAVFRGEAAQVEQHDLDIGSSGKDLARDLDEAIGLGHFSRAGVLAARRIVDEKNDRSAAVGVTAFGIVNALAGGQPIDR
jgi:hypothetical protein